MKKTLLLITLFTVEIIAAQNNQSLDFENEFGDIRRLYIENKLDSAESKLKRLEAALLSSESPFHAKEYAYTICTLSDIYIKQNRFKEGEQIIDEAESNLHSHGEQAYSQRKVLLIQKGKVRLMIEDVDGAKNFLFQAKRLFEEEGDNTSIDYALCLSGLATAYQKTGDFCFSNILNNVAANIFQNVASTIGADLSTDSRYLTIWTNIALNFRYMGDIDSFNTINEYILKIGEVRGGAGNYVALVNKAFDEILSGNYEKAIQLLDRADENEYGYMYKDYAYQNILISLYLTDNNRAIDVLKHYIDYSKENLSTVLLSYAESERENYWSQRAIILELITNAITWKYKTPELQKEAYNVTLYTKSLLTRFSKIISDYAKNNTSDIIRNKYSVYSNLKKRINTKGISVDSVLFLREAINGIERELISSIDSYTDIFDDSKITCDKVRKSLKSNEVAIEFVLLPELLSEKEGVGYYGALIERSDFSHPAVVKLCEFDALDEVLEKHNMPDKEFVDSLYSSFDERLYSLIFKPLENYIYDGETIYFSPVSSLHKVNFQAIPVNGRRMMDKNVLIEVSSTAQIIECRERPDKFSKAFIVGGVDYNENIKDMVNEALNYTMYSPCPYVATRSNNRGSWDAIPGTQIEAQQIDSILNKHKVHSVFLCGGKASEEAFKELDGKAPDLLHFATHGFFYEEKDDASSHFFDNIISYSDKHLPMQYSGLLLAGANNAWRGNQPPAYVEDGILTAEEISLMDLSGTKIAVLSACDTGLGKIDDVDGVYGLQRGFKMAGVETVVISLWKISDEATQVLMVEFYRNLMNGKTKRESLQEAQQYLRKVENGKYDNPWYWASFIMLDGLD